jgi:hypothetical protein
MNTRMLEDAALVIVSAALALALTLVLWSYETLAAL